jgi:hypothetical protein
MGRGLPLLTHRRTCKPNGPPLHDPLLPRREESLIPPSERGLNVEETGVTLNEKARNRSRLNLFNDNNFQNEFLRRAGERRAVLLEGAPVCQE